MNEATTSPLSELAALAFSCNYLCLKRSLLEMFRNIIHSQLPFFKEYDFTKTKKCIVVDASFVFICVHIYCMCFRGE